MCGMFMLLEKESNVCLIDVKFKEIKFKGIKLIYLMIDVKFKGIKCKLNLLI